MDDSDVTLPIPRPTPKEGGLSEPQAQALLAVGEGAFDTRPASSGARGWEPPSVEMLQRALPQYEITALIARGGMGAVYKGMQRALNRPVAIKVLPPEMDDGGDLQFAARFKQEAQAMAQLSHPNIVAVFDAGEVYSSPLAPREEPSASPTEMPPGLSHAGVHAEPPAHLAERDGYRTAPLLYFVMEFIEGTDVARLIASEGRLDTARAVPIIAAVCEALAFAHEEGIVHRDIKPSNIMIDKRGRVKVADFGLAKAVNIESTLMTRSDVAMGTPDFVAPEALIPGMKVDGRADLYAVGVMLYQMLTGKIPRGRFELPSGVVPQVDQGFDAIVDRAMQTDREKRYSTATEMKRDVERVEARSGGFQPPGPEVTAVGNRRSLEKSRMSPILIAAAVVVLGGAGAFFLMNEPTNTAGALAPPSSPWSRVNLEALALEDDTYRQEAGGWFRMSGRRTFTPFSSAVTNAGLRVEFGGSLQHSKMPEILLREQASQNFNAYLDGDGQKLVIQRYDGTQTQEDARRYKTLGELTLPVPVRPGVPYTLEFLALGSRLIARLNGATLEVAAPDPPASGLATLYNPNFDTYRKVEFINLDGLSEAEALKAVLSGAGAWSVLRDSSRQGQAAQVILRAEAEKTNLPPAILARALPLWDGPEKLPAGKGIRWENNALCLQEASPMTGSESRDAILRATILARPGSHPFIALRARPGKTDRCQLSMDFDRRKMALRVMRDASAIQEWDLPPAMKPNDWVPVELRAIGDTFSVWIGGQNLGTVQSSAVNQKGQAMIFGAGNGDYFRDIEYTPLDGLSEAEALKAAGAASSPPNAPNYSATTSPAVKAGQWIDATEEVKQNGLERNLLSMEGDWLIAKRGINYFPVSGTLELADAAMRVLFRGRVR